MYIFQNDKNCLPCKKEVKIPKIILNYKTFEIFALLKKVLLIGTITTMFSKKCNYRNISFQAYIFSK